MHDGPPQYILYARVAASTADSTALVEKQKAVCREEVSRNNGRVVAECVDRYDGLEPGPELERLFDDLEERQWHCPTVVVERLSRVSRDVEVVRFVTRRIHDLDGELVSCAEPHAQFQFNPRCPASIGQTMFLEGDAVLDAARRFGATIASHIRVECPIHFEGLSSFLRKGELVGVRAIDQIMQEPQMLPSARDGIEMFKWLADDEVQGIELENAFVEGLVNELLLHINVRSGR